MLKRAFLIILLASVYSYAHAQSFCHLVQSIGTSYTDTIETPGTYYFSAMIDDLPMDVYFITTDPTCTTPPDIWSDLTCTPGVYNDPNIQTLIKDTAKYGISVPMKLKCESQWVDSVGGYVHHLKIGKSYRNKLRLVGVDYNLPAYVKINLPCGGIARMEQDTSSQACINEARRINIQDNTRVLANDSLTTYLLMYKEWLTQADSVLLHWEGSEPCIVWIGTNDCEFIPDVQHAWDFYEIPANGDYHLSRKTMENALKDKQDTTGYFFAKIFSAEEGYFSTRPLIPETKGATLLNFDSTQVVHIEDKNEFFCFPKDWQNVQWEAKTRRVVKLFVHTSPELAPVDSFTLDLQEDTILRVLQWTTPEMKLLREKATGSLLFVRFECSGNFKFTPYALSESSFCFQSAVRIRSGVPYACSKDALFSLNYADWKDYPMEIQWETPNSSNLQNLFFADTCQLKLGSNWSMTNYSTKIRCVYYKQTKRGGETWTVDSASIAEWEPRVTPEGCFFILMTGSGTLTITNAKPAEQDPEGELDPEEEEEQQPEDPPTATPQIGAQPTCIKKLHNGHIIILREGKQYTLTGQQIRL